MSSLACSSPRARACLHFHYFITNQRWKITACPGRAGPPSERGGDLLRLSFAIKSLFNVWPPCFPHVARNSITGPLYGAALPCQHLSYQRATGGSQPESNFTFSCSLEHKLQLSQSLCQMALVWSCIKHKARNLRQVSEQGTTLSLLQPPPPLSLIHTHTPPADPHRHVPKIIIQVSLCIHI